MAHTKTSPARRLWRDSAGNVLAITAACLPLLIGAAGLAVDTAQWTYWRRQLQREADSAALAGAFAKAQGKDAIVAAQTDLARTNTLTLSRAAGIHTAPTTGAFVGNDQAVRVSLTTAQRLPFSGMFMSSTPVISSSSNMPTSSTTRWSGSSSGRRRPSSSR